MDSGDQSGVWLRTMHMHIFATISGEVAGGAGGAVAPPAGLKKGAPK